MLQPAPSLLAVAALSSLFVDPAGPVTEPATEPARGPEAIVIRHDRTDKEAVELGKRFDCAVRLPGGSGTLIGKRWIVTAAHVAHGMPVFSPRAWVQGKPVAVRQVLFHPDSASRGNAPPRVDLALVELEEDVEGVEPAKLYDGTGEEGQPVFVVGYGDFGNGQDELTYTDGVRRAATNTVEKAGAERLQLVFDAPPEGTSLEGVGGPGDSGGPLLMETPKGLFLIGVSSASMGGRPGSYGVTDLYVRVSHFLNWIEATPEEAEGKPPQGPVIVDWGDDLTKGERTELLRAFFESFSAGTEEAAGSFGERHRSQRSRRRNPTEAFVRRMLRRHGELGSLEPERVALVSPERWIVLAKTTKGPESRRVEVFLRFAEEDEGVRLDDWRAEEARLGDEDEGEQKDAEAESGN